MGVEICPKMKFNPPPLQCLSLKKSHAQDKMVLILGKRNFTKVRLPAHAELRGNKSSHYLITVN